MTVLAESLVNSVFSHPDRLRAAALESIRVLTAADVARILGITEKTVRAWHDRQEHGFSMNVGPGGHLTMRVKDFEDWYARAYKKPKPLPKL